MPSRKAKKIAPPPRNDAVRREAALVFAIVFLGCMLRGMRPEAMAVEHFDEGVYASNLYCGHLDPPFAYPMRHLYAPPLFPALLEWAQVFAGPAAVMWVNVVLGSLTVLAVWWTTREWFGRTAAIAAAVLAATSEYHIAFSRMALTDVPLSLCMLLGVYAGWRAILTGRKSWIAAAGLLAGVAWCTKYNGWLTLAVTGSGTAAALLSAYILSRKDSRRGTPPDDAVKKKIANCELQIANCKLSLATSAWAWSLSALIAACLFWWFVVRELASVGGYAAVAQNHSGYFVGLAGWWTGFVRQAAGHAWVMGWPTCVGVGIASLVCIWTSDLATERVASGRPSAKAEAPAKRSAKEALIALTIAAGLAITGGLLTASGLLAISALAGFVCVWWTSTRTTSETPEAERSSGAHLAAWMLLAWFFGLLVSVPLYYPYPRLSLPWVVVTWPLTGAAIAFAWERINRKYRGEARQGATAGTRTPAVAVPVPPSKNQVAKPVRLMATVLLLTVAVATGWLVLDRVLGAQQAGGTPIRWRAAWQSRDQLRAWFEMVQSEIGPEAESRANSGSDVSAVVYVAGDPAVFFQLSAANRIPGVVFLPIAEPTGLKAAAGVPTYLVTHVAPGVTESVAPNLSRTRGYYYRPSDLVLLDRMPAGEIRQQGSSNDALRLYRVGE